MRRIGLVVGIIVAVAVAAGAVWAVWQITQFPRTLRATLAAAVPGLTIDSLEVSGTPPNEVVARGVTVANPEGYQAPTALTVKTLRLRFSPWLWVVSRVLLTDLEAEAPVMTFERDLGRRSNWEALWAQITEAQAAAAGGAVEDAEEARETGPSWPRVIPTRLVVTDGRFDLLDPLLQADGVVLAIRSLAVQFDLDLLGQRPVVPLIIAGDFVNAAEQPVGGLRFDIQFSRVERQATGTVRFEHRALADLNPYVAGRSAYRIVEGDGTADIRGRITAAQEFWCEITMVVRTLVVDGEEPVLGMPPQELLKHLQDSDGAIRLTIEVQGRLTDPQFDFHDQLVRQLDRAILTRLAERGVSIPEALAVPSPT